MHLHKDIDFKSHLKAINPKIAFLTHRLSIIRLKDNLKLNRNLYGIFVEPLFRLGFALLLGRGRRPKQDFVKHMGIKFKIFCRLPMTTANRVLQAITGDLEAKIDFALEN